MRNKLLAILLSALMAANISACSYVPEKGMDETAGSEGDVSTDRTNQSQLITHNRVQLENILASNYTWEEFRCQYPNCRKADEFINGEYSYFRVVCEEFPETFFVFDLVIGENGFSEIQLEAISAKLEVVLPEYVNMSFDDIIATEGDSVGFTYADELYEEKYGFRYDRLHIYRNDFFYETTAHLQQGDVLKEHMIVMRRYSGKNLRPCNLEADLSIDPNATWTESIENLVVTQCSLETFQKNYPDTEILEETETSVTVTTPVFPQVKFVFQKAVDVWIGFERTILETAVIDASALFPEYVGADDSTLLANGFELENRVMRDKHYMFFYKESTLYVVDLGMTSGNTPIHEIRSDTAIYVYPYSEQWIRPW